MIRITFLGDDCIRGFEIKGHSGFSNYGSDIVCSAVSSAVYMAANTITDVIKAKADIKVSDGSFCLSVSEDDASRCSDVLDGLKLHLLGISEQYQKYITVTNSEV